MHVLETKPRQVVIRFLAICGGRRFLLCTCPCEANRRMLIIFVLCYVTMHAHIADLIQLYACTYMYVHVSVSSGKNQFGGGG